MHAPSRAVLQRMSSGNRQVRACYLGLVIIMVIVSCFSAHDELDRRRTWAAHSFAMVKIDMVSYQMMPQEALTIN